MDYRVLEMVFIWQEEDSKEYSFGNKLWFNGKRKTVDIKGLWQRVEQDSVI
jgi:hypothetical protein